MKKKKFAILFLAIIILFSNALRFKEDLLLNRIILLSLVIIATLLITKVTSKISKEKVHLKFAVIAAFFGIILIFSVPIFHGSDETSHFFKVYSVFNNVETKIVDGQKVDLIPKLTIVRDENIAYSISLRNQTIDPNNIIETTEARGARLYSAVSYIPYLLPVLLFQKIMNLSIYYIGILSRLVAFIIWILLSVHTIKVMPKRKEFMAFLCLMPVVLSTVTTFSADLMTNTTILMFLAYWYRLYEEKRPIKKREIIIISLLGIFTACAKIVYALIFLILFLLPKECFGSKKRKTISLSIIIIAILTATIINTIFVGGDLLDVYPKIIEQKEFIQNNFFTYIIILIKSIVKNFNYIYTFPTNGERMLFHDGIRVSDIVAILYIAILLISLKLDESNIKHTKMAKVLYTFINVAIICIIYTSLYIQFTATHYGIGFPYVVGVQLRYIIPMVAMLILVNNKKKLELDRNYLWYGVIFLNEIFIFQTILRFI